MGINEGDRTIEIELRKLLLDREDQFNRCLAEKLMTYALGCELEVSDRPSIDAILTDLDDTNGGLHDLVRLIVLSESFRNN